MKSDIVHLDNESDDDQLNNDLNTNPRGFKAGWTNLNFDRISTDQIKCGRFTYVNGLFKHENGPYILENAF